ncbi:MAG: phosphatase PAP2 family protein [Muribaculaceae bacterium]|nr:phosphatase PAP2 family protein [Muribaculaceae bacterium]
MNFRKILASFCFAALSLSMTAQYFTQYEAPDPTKFLPGPPTYFESRFSVDTKHYFDGKDMTKDTKFRALVTSDANWGVEFLPPKYSEIMGVTITASNATNAWRMLVNCFSSAGYGTNKKNYYLRKRPCVMYNEQPASNDYSTSPVETLTTLKRTYSYPSSHSIVGWDCTLLIAACAPHFQDALIKRAYDFGQSRVWCGAHWQSDVDDARTIGTACIGHMMAMPLFKTQLAAGRSEITKLLSDSLGISAPDYDAENYYDSNHMPNPVTYLPAPPSTETSSPEFAHDLDQYVWGLGLRNTERGTKARFDTSNDFDVLLGEFAPAMGHDLSEEKNPATYNLLKMAFDVTNTGCVKAQEYYNRPHPYEFFKEKAYTFESQDEMANVGSYPSAHAARAWTVATILISLDPVKQDSVLNVAYQLAMSNVIAGTSWRSDVEAGFLVSGATVTRLLSNPNFMAALEAAQQEYETSTHQVVTDQADLPVDRTEANDPVFTIDGRPATQDSRGILISRNKKTVRW